MEERKTTRVRMFIASPADVSEERKRLKSIIDELNQDIADRLGLVLQFVGWETHAWPAIGEDAQDVINQQIGRYDIFIGIMWKSFGTPTNRADSGTEEEFDRAYKFFLEYGKPRIMLYFNNAPFFPSSTEESEQLTKVLNFKKKVKGRGALYWEYNGPDEFEKFVRSHLTREILRIVDYAGPISPPQIPKLPLEFYQILFNELDIYIDQFDQLMRDFKRELKGEQLIFAVDFSEIHDFLYPCSTDLKRTNLNQYVFSKIENPLTLMPGAIGELLTDLERALPDNDAMNHDPITTYKDVATFIKNFPSSMNDEERIIELYSKAEEELKKAWRELFVVVMQEKSRTPFDFIKYLIDQGKLSPIKGVQQITHFPLEVQQKTQQVRNYLDTKRPGRIRNNQVDTIDFAVTWLLNSIEKGTNKRYISIYTQSGYFIKACTISPQLIWEEDYLVRGAHYFKFRTGLQELFSDTKKRYDFVLEWMKKCKTLQNEIENLDILEKDPSILEKPTLVLLDLYRQFDEECRIPLSFSGEVGKNEKELIRNRASKLYGMLKDKGEFKARTGEAFEFLKRYLNDLQNQLTLFAPEKIKDPNAKIYMENLARWLEAEKIEGPEKEE